MAEKPIDLTLKRASSILKLAERDPVEAERRFNSLPMLEKMGMVLSVRGRDRERLILLSKEPHRLVERMPEEEFYYTVKEIGERDALALLSLASSRQMAFLLDVETWRRDRLKPRDFLRWLELMLECGEEKVLEVLRGLDEELLVTFLQKHLRVFKPGTEVEAVEMDQDFFTLDNQYFIKFRFRYSEQPLMRLLDLLFRGDHKLYLRLMEGVIWEVPAEVEELAFRWRQGRLADRGFPELEEAIEIYSYVDPEMVRIEQGMKEVYGPDDEMKRWGEVGSSFYLMPLPSDSFLREVLSMASEEGLDWLKGELVYLCNRAMVAEGIDPSDVEAVKELLGRVYDYLNLGLGYLARGDPREGLRGVRRLYLKEIFQVGFSLTLRLRRRTERILRSSPWFPEGKEDLHLLDSPHREVVEGLLLKKPLLYEGLLDPSSSRYRTFRDLEEFGRVEEVLEEVVVLSRLHSDLYGLRPEELRAMDLQGCHPERFKEVTFKTITVTSLARWATGGTLRFEPLSSEELKAFLRKALKAEGQRLRPELKEGFRREVEALFEDLLAPLSEADRNGARGFLEGVLRDLVAEFGHLDLSRPLDPRFLRWVLVRLRR